MEDTAFSYLNHVQSPSDNGGPKKSLKSPKSPHGSKSQMQNRIEEISSDEVVSS